MRVIVPSVWSGFWIYKETRLYKNIPYLSLNPMLLLVFSTERIKLVLVAIITLLHCAGVAAESREAVQKQAQRDQLWLQKLDQPEYVIPGLEAGQSRLLAPGEHSIRQEETEGWEYDEETMLLEPPEILADDQPSLRSWRFGIGLVDQHAEHFDSRRLLSVSARYPLSDFWYLLAGLEYGLLSEDPIQRDDGLVLVAGNTTTLMVHSGLGVPLLRGIMRTPMGAYAPWQISVEGLLGEQYTGNLSGRYVGAGFNTTLMLRSVWLGTDWRWFNVDDDALKAAGINQGIQAGVSLGIWF